MLLLDRNGSGAASYVTIDNIEWTGFQQTSGSGSALVQTLADHTVVENCYFHGWSRASGISNSSNFYMFTANISVGTAKVAGSSFHNNVVDGQDTTRDNGGGVNSSEYIYNNVFRYLVVGAHNAMTYVHGNLVEDGVASYDSGEHCDGIYAFDAFTGTTQYLYNNVLRNNSCPGSMILWDPSSIGGSCPSCVGYLYNNVIYGVSNASSALAVGYHTSTGNTGKYYVYNNTVEFGNGCIQNSDTGTTANSTTYYSNMHCIAAAEVCNTKTDTQCVNNGGNLLQTEAVANSDGYTSKETYAYSPTTASAPTVGTGINWASMCSGSLAALCSDTSYPTYDATNHTVVMRPVNQRPPLNGGNWDIGAYDFSSSQAQAPQPPTNLTVSVQ